MFDEKLNSVPSPSNPATAAPTSANGNSFIVIAVVAISLAVVIIAGGAVFYFSLNKNKPAVGQQPIEAPVVTSTNEVASSTTATSTEQSRFLPTADTASSDGGDEAVTIVKNAENLSFGYFYKPKPVSVVDNKNKYNLPLNIKTDVSNYYDLERKTQLSVKLDDLNQNGFAVSDNIFKDEANDFYGSYRSLANKNIPILITSDFLIYDYQQNLKEIFKDIENNVFYQELWDINRNLFDTANAKYKEMHNLIGNVNDPVLEGQRLETVFLGTTLELLKPKPNQLNNQRTTDEGEFTNNDFVNFNFDLPDYLKDDVSREVALIQEGKKITNSPIFLYQRNYQDFAVPTDYARKAKLYNFYLATKWLNSQFPLYYKGAACPQCLLDKNDWQRSMIAASNLARDFANNQDFKNRWAKVYKIMSYFYGLREGLTYLDYDRALQDLFGADYNPAAIFDIKNNQREDNFGKLQKKLRLVNFEPLNGADNQMSWERWGLKMLQDHYWPEGYLLKQLAQAGAYLGQVKEGDVLNKLINSTVCADKTQAIRCNGSGYDIINLFYNLKGNSYFDENSNYKDYNKQVMSLKDSLAKFQAYDWHGNNYWTNLDVINKFINSNNGGGYFANNKLWQDKNINVALASRVNFQLPADSLKLADTVANSLNAVNVNYDDDYVEIDPVLVEELIADTKMLRDMIISLGIIKGKDSAYHKFSSLISDLTGVQTIMQKELGDQPLTDNERRLAKTMTGRFSVLSQGSKQLNLVSTDKRKVNEDISGVKLLFFVYARNGRKTLAVGPIFNYRELMDSR